MPAMKRRFQFRLRTSMIAVTLLSVACAYVGWQARIVRQREQWLAANPNCNRVLVFRQGPFESALTSEGPLIAGGDRGKAPGWLRMWLGDQTLAEAILPEKATKAEIAEAVRDFPETSFYRRNYPDAILDGSPVAKLHRR